MCVHVYMCFFSEIFFQLKEEGQRERERVSQADSVLNVEPDVGLDP